MASEKEWQQDISTTVDAHTITIADHEERITANKVKLDEHETRIDNIETTSNVGQFATRVQAIEDKNTEQDSAIDTLKKNVSDNLQTAKQYTETKLADYATKTENSNTLEQAKQYANSKADDILNQAKTDASQKYLPLSGGVLTGNSISRSVNNNCLRLYGGYSPSADGKEQGGVIVLNGKDCIIDGKEQPNICLRGFDEKNNNVDLYLNGKTKQLEWAGKNIVRSVNNVNADINGNVTLSSVASATKATQDGNGADIASTYVKLASAQTISAQHNFSAGVKIGGYLITVG